MLIVRYKDPKFDEGPKMIIGFSGNELSLDYTTGYISGWKIEEPTPLKVSLLQLQDIYVLHAYCSLFFTDKTIRH